MACRAATDCQIRAITKRPGKRLPLRPKKKSCQSVIPRFRLPHQWDLSYSLDAVSLKQQDTEHQASCKSNAGYIKSNDNQQTRCISRKDKMLCRSVVLRQGNSSSSRFPGSQDNPPNTRLSEFLNSTCFPLRYEPHPGLFALLFFQCSHGTIDAFASVQFQKQANYT